MSYLDRDRLASLSAADFQAASPYPWLNPEGLLTDQGHEALTAKAPPLSLFTQVFGKRRKHGQQSHDRFLLDYDPALPLDDCWHEFVDELQAPAYQEAMASLFRARRFRMRLHWHYTPAGCSVSPHCDAQRKLGSHIFYLNTEQDWRPEWGGQTLILDDAGRFDHRSAPAFDDFERQIAVSSMGNRSLLFARVAHSWHGVEAVTCPEGAFRKAFIVVFEPDGGWVGALRHRLNSEDTRERTH